VIFKYDPERINEYRKNKVLNVLPIIFFGIFTTIPMLYFQMHDIENIVFTLSITFFMMLIGFCVMLLIMYKSGDKEYYSYQIECNENNITITSKMLQKTINIKLIKKISKDAKNNLYIETSKINEVKIQKYIKNIEELELFLSNISLIELHTTPFSFLQYIPLFSYFIWRYISKVGSTKLYFIFGFFIFSITAYSLLKIIFDQLKLRHKIIGIVLNGIILFFIGRALFLSIVYILK